MPERKAAPPACQHDTYPCDCTGCDCSEPFHNPGPGCPGQEGVDFTPKIGSIEHYQQIVRGWNKVGQRVCSIIGTTDVDEALTIIERMPAALGAAHDALEAHQKWSGDHPLDREKTASVRLFGVDSMCRKALAAIKDVHRV